MTHEKRFRWHVIHDHIKHIENPVGAEIGAHRGECSGHLLELHPRLKLYMIDMWSPNTYAGKGDDAATEPFRKIYQDESRENYNITYMSTEIYADRRIILIGGSVERAQFFFNDELDFCFIDASHAYKDVKADIIAWLPKIKKGGYLFCHDYGLFEGVTRAVTEMFTFNQDYDLYIDDDYMAAVRV